jgi:hypothetical protein
MLCVLETGDTEMKLTIEYTLNTGEIVRHTSCYGYFPMLWIVALVRRFDAITEGMGGKPITQGFRFVANDPR